MTNGLKMLLRALFRRCPNCGEPHIFKSWFTLREYCPRRGLKFEREEGYWSGAMAIDSIVTEGLFAVLLLVVLIRTWPDIPMIKLLIAALALNGIFPIFFYPLAKTFWVAFDLMVRPRHPSETSGERW